MSFERDGAPLCLHAKAPSRPPSSGHGEGVGGVPAGRAERRIDASNPCSGRVLASETHPGNQGVSDFGPCSFLFLCHAGEACTRFQCEFSGVRQHKLAPRVLEVHTVCWCLAALACSQHLQWRRKAS